MAEDVLWNLDADGSSTMAVLDEIDAALTTLSDSIAAVAASASDLDALDTAMAELSAMTQQNAADAASLDATFSATGNAAMAAASEIGSLAASLDTVAASTGAAAASADTAAASTEAMGAAAGSATGMMEGLQAAVGPLMMIGTVAALVGGKLVSMGLDGQKGESLLRGMAGASQSDIQALQVDAIKLGVNMKDAAAGFYEVSSAGYSGAGAVTVFDAAMRLAEGGGASAQDTMSALTAIMHDYNASASDATHYTDLMDTAVLRGKQSMSDFASSIGPLAAAGSNVGMSFEEVAAAEATMTQINPHVAQDAMQLRSLFDFLSPSMGGTKKAADELGLSFDESGYSSKNLLGKLQYLADIAGGTNTAAFVKLTGGVRGSTAAIDLLKNNAGSFKDNLTAMGHAAGATGKSFAQWEDTIPAHLDKVGASISVFATRLMDAIGPRIIPIIDHVSTAFGDFANFMIAHGDVLNATLAGLAAVIGSALVAAVVAFVAASGPIILILLGIGAAVAAVVYVVQHWGDITTWLQQQWQRFTSWFSSMWTTYIVQPVQSAIGFFQNAWSTITANAQSAWSKITSGVSSGWATVETRSQQAANGIGSWFSQIGATIGAFAARTWTAFINIPVIQNALHWLVSIWNSTVAIVQSAWSTAISYLSSGWTTVQNSAQAAVTGIAGFFQNLWGTITSGASSAWSGLQSAWSAISHEAQQLGSVIAKTLSQGLSFLGPAMADIGNAFQAALPALQDAWKAIQNLGDSLKLAGISVWQSLQQAFSQVAQVVGGALAQAWQSLQQSMAVIWPLLQQVASLVGGAFLSIWKSLQQAFSEVASVVGGALSLAWKTLAPILAQIASLVGGALSQAWKFLQPVIAQIASTIGGQVLTALKAIGIVIGGVVLLAIALLLGALVGLAKGIATLVQGLVQFFSGLVQFFSGIVQVVSGIVAFIVDLCTGHFDRLGKDLGVIWGGIVTMFKGVWAMIQGVFIATVGTVISIVGGLVTTVVQFFFNLYSTLIGHSIIPDMVNGIINWIGQLPGRALTFVNQLVSGITSNLGSLGSKALGWAGDMISGFVTGIENGIGSIGNAVGKIASTIANSLHFSVPEEGVLASADKWMPDMIDLFVGGIQANQHKLKASVAGLASQMASGIGTPSLALSASSTPLGGGSSALPLLSAILSAIQQQQRPGGQTAINMYNSNSIHGVQNIQDLANSLNSLSGNAYEQGQRGIY